MGMFIIVEDICFSCIIIRGWNFVCGGVGWGLVLYWMKGKN